MARSPIPKRTQFVLPINDLTKMIDVDDNRGRSVPQNFGFIEEGYLSKDTGVRLFGEVDVALRHSLYHYKLKSGTSYILSGCDDNLQIYNFTTEAWEDLIQMADVTITIATPGVVTLADHNLVADDTVKFSTTGALPTGIIAGVTYYVIAAGLTSSTFRFSTTLGGAAVNTSGTQSGIQSLQTFHTFTAEAEFGFYTYDNVLYGCNAVEPLFKWTGSQFTFHDAVPQGNILEVFEDRLFISGVTGEPYTTYYSDVADPLTFQPDSVINPLGEDKITNLKNYYGSLLIFKQNSIWKLTFQYDQVVDLFLPKIDLQSKNFGCASRKGATWTDNDIWFFTGTEVRAIGFKENEIGVLGVDRSVISTPIAETLKYINPDDYEKCAVFFDQALSRFFLSVPLSSNTPNVLFVCHALYGNSWTKFTDRDKAKVNGFLAIDGTIYTTTASGNYGVRVWDPSILNDVDEDGDDVAINGSFYLRRIEDKDFNRSRIYRYLGLDFKNLQALVTVNIKHEIHNDSELGTKTFYVGNDVEDSEGALGETPFGQELIADSYGEDDITSPYSKKKISFLYKSQGIIIGLSNNRIDQTFTIARMELLGMDQPSKYFSSRNISTMS